MSAVTAPIKADMEMTGTEAETATIARAAPALAPEETPTISGDLKDSGSVKMYSYRSRKVLPPRSSHRGEYDNLPLLIPDYLQSFYADL